MNIKDFKQKKQSKKDTMKLELENCKLENVLSLWYFVTSGSKGSIVGSKS